MPTPTKGARLGGSPSHERHILANLAAALFEHGAITTTESRAKRLRPYAERLITFAKRGDLHARRRVMKLITSKGVVHTLFTEIGPQMADRNGGYTAPRRRPRRSLSPSSRPPPRRPQRPPSSRPSTLRTLPQPRSDLSRLTA